MIITLKMHAAYCRLKKGGFFVAQISLDGELTELQTSYPGFLHSYAVQASKYYWLFAELQTRIYTIRQALLFLDALPKFMKVEDENQSLQYVVSYVGKLFTVSQIGEIARDADDVHPFFNDENPFWLDLQEALDQFTDDYDMRNLPMLYVDLSEYVVRAVRLFLQIREAQHHAIDRKNFLAIINAKATVKNAG